MGGVDLANAAPEGFGTVQFSRNNFSNVHGVDNQGTIVHNSNLELFTSNCTLNLSDNSNAKVRAENSTMSWFHCQNISFYGKGCTTTLRNNSNTNIAGMDSAIEGIANTNLGVKVSKSVLNLMNNTNMKVRTVDGVVTAKGNVNLDVSGEGGKVFVKDTENLELRMSALNPKSEAIHKISLGPQCNSLFGKWVSNLLQSFGNRGSKSVIDFVDQAEIEGDKYKLGAFNFTMEQQSKDKYEVKLEEDELDKGSYKIQVRGPSEITIQGSKDGESQTLKLCGPKVSQKDINNNVFIINLKG